MIAFNCLSVTTCNMVLSMSIKPINILPLALEKKTSPQSKQDLTQHFPNLVNCVFMCLNWSLKLIIKWLLLLHLIFLSCCNYVCIFTSAIPIVFLTIHWYFWYPVHTLGAYFTCIPCIIYVIYHFPIKFNFVLCVSIFISAFLLFYKVIPYSSWFTDTILFYVHIHCILCVMMYVFFLYVYNFLLLNHITT